MGKTLRFRGRRDGGWRKRIIQGQKVHRGWPGRERMCRREGEIKRKKKVRLFGGFFAVLCNFG